MPRVKRGVTAHARHKKVLEQAKGFRGRRKNVFRIAKEAVMKAGQYAYRDRRARKRVFISFAANRRVHGQWQSALPSRFIGDLPEAHVDMVADEGFYGNYGSFRDQGGFSSPYSSPGWRRAQEARASGRGTERAPIIDVPAKLVATADPSAARYATGERVFHQKFGYGRIVSVEGNKLLINFDKAGSKRVMDNFVEKV